MSDKRTSSADERVTSASQEAYELALDALHDTALQEALFRRLDQQLSTEQPRCGNCDTRATAKTPPICFGQ